MDEELKKKLAAEAEAQRVADLEAASRAAVKAERERADGIRAAAKVTRVSEEFTSKLLTDGVSLDKARELMMIEMARVADETPTRSGSGIQVGRTEREGFREGAMAWLLYRSMTAELREAIAKRAPGFENVNLDPGKFRGASIADLAKIFLQHRGVDAGFDRADMIGKALAMRDGGYSTTSDFAVLLENVLHKQLMAGYAIQEDVWSRFCKVIDVDDFRNMNLYQTGSLGVLDDKTEHGEYRNKALPDGRKLTVNVGTKGNIIAISREALVNDDLGALNNLMAMLGRSGKLTIEKSVFDLLAANSGAGPTQTDTNPFFHSSRSNIGSAAALSVASLDADRQILKSQRDPSSNEYLNTTPAILLVGLASYTAARVINNSAYDHDSTKLQKPNGVQSLFRDIVESPRVSGTKRYMFADPNAIATIVVAFLNGTNRAPQLESKDGWRVDGTEMRIRLDVKAQMHDYKGAVYNAGA